MVVLSVDLCYYYNTCGGILNLHWGIETSWYLALLAQCVVSRIDRAVSETSTKPIEIRKRSLGAVIACCMWLRYWPHLPPYIKLSVTKYSHQQSHPPFPLPLLCIFTPPWHSPFPLPIPIQPTFPTSLIPNLYKHNLLLLTIYLSFHLHLTLTSYEISHTPAPTSQPRPPPPLS